MMKHNNLLLLYLISLIFFFNNIACFSQNNLIPNPGFEYGQNSPKCVYFGNDIGNDIYDWKQATCVSVWPINNCKYHYSYPDWMDISCGVQIPGNTRFIYLGKIYKPNGNPKQGYEDAIRTGLISKLSTVKYMFRIDYSDAIPKSTQPQDNNPTRIRIYFTKYSTHWSANWGNIKYSFLMYPPNQWVQHWMYLNLSGFSDANKLGNIVMDCEKGQAYIDYVELAAVCPDSLLIQNHSFFYNEDELPYKSGGTLIAGNNVTSSVQSGDVVIHNGATEKFTASNKIILEPGFSVENGGHFVAKIESCNSNDPNRYAAPIIKRTSENTLIYINNNDTLYIYDDAVDTLNCGIDSLKIFGLDGDTVSYTNYWWDYGNGITSTSKVASIFYNKSGSYKVKLAITDSAGNIDTLSKIYVVPDCNNKRLNGINKCNKNNKIKIYPNPSTQTFNVYSSSGFSQKPQVSNILGQTINVRFKPMGKTGYKIDMSGNPKGIYLIRIGATVKRLVLE